MDLPQHLVKKKQYLKEHTEKILSNFQTEKLPHSPVPNYLLFACKA